MFNWAVGASGEMFNIGADRRLRRLGRAGTTKFEGTYDTNCHESATRLGLKELQLPTLI